MERNPDKFWNPYLAGVALGLVLLSTYLVMGKSLGASGPALRVGVVAVDAAAPSLVARTPPYSKLYADGNPLDNYLVFVGLGTFLGGFVAAYTSGRLKKEIVKGPNVSNGARLAMALGGGLIMGAAARLSRGCASGQALSGGGVMSVGSWAFMFAIFAGGYAAAWFVRREWR